MPPEAKPKVTVEDLRSIVDEGMKKFTAEIPEMMKAEMEPLLAAQENKLKEAGALAPEPDPRGAPGKRTADMVRALFAKDIPEVMRLSDNQSKAWTGQGYLVPEEFAGTIFTLLDQYGVARKDCFIYPMGTDIANLPKLLTGLSMTWIGSSTHAAAGWATGTRKPTTEPTFDRVRLTIRDLAGVIPMDINLVKDTNTNLEALLPTLIANAIASAEDSALFNGVTYGDGSNVGGLLSVGTARLAAGAAFTDATIDNLLDMQGDISSAALIGAKYYMHPSVKAHFRKKGLAAGWAGRITLEDALGYPVEVTNALPAMSASAADTEFVAFGSLKNVYLGSRQALAIDTADQATVYDAAGAVKYALFQDNMIGLRPLVREDIKIMQNAAFAVLKTAAS